MCLFGQAKGEPQESLKFEKCYPSVECISSYLIAVLRLWRQAVHGDGAQRAVGWRIVDINGICGDGRGRIARTLRVFVHVGYIVARRGQVLVVAWKSEGVCAR